MRQGVRRIASAAAVAALSTGTIFAFGAGTANAATNIGDGVLDPSLTEVNILNFNDFHGRIDENNGGATGLAFADNVKTSMAKYDPAKTLLLSDGDNIGASPFTSMSDADNPTLAYLNALGVEASAVGNHEFDKGVDDLTGRVSTAAAFPYLAANVYAKGTTTPILDEYVVIEKNGLKIGVIGAVTQETPALTGPNATGTVDFVDPVDAVNRVADQLTDGNEANGEADVLIAEYHEGAGAGTPEGATIEQEVAHGGAFAKIVTQTSAAVSAIFTGHTHKEYAWDGPVPGEPGQTRPILQAASYATFLGHVQLGFDANKKLVQYKVENLPTSTVDQSKPEGQQTMADWKAKYPAIWQIIDAAIQKAAIIGKEHLGNVTADITTAYAAGKRDDRASESTLSNLIAQSMVDVLNDPGRSGADIGLMNPGGVRAELLFNDGADNTGDITYAEAAAVVPFANTLQTIELTGAQLKTVLEQQWQTNEDGTIPSRPYLQLGLSDNLTYTYDPAATQGAHITSVSLDGAPLDLTATYTVVGSSFLIGGGDNFREVAAGQNMKDSGLIDTESFATWIKDKGTLSPSFNRHAVVTNGQPDAVTIGEQTSFAASGLDLTSLGSPSNTELTAYVGDTAVGMFSVSEGAATIAFTTPDGIATGPATLKLVATPSNTTVTFPVTVNAATPITPPTTEPPTTQPPTTEPPAPQPTVTVDHAKIAPGSKITVKAVNFSAAVGSMAQVELHSDPVTIGQMSVGSGGSATGVFTIPAATTRGAHSIVVTAGGVTASVQITVTASGGKGGTLASTGADVAPKLEVAAIMLVLGGGLTLAGRRRNG
ncbi:5'-nucleotidase [Antricoccus suffuscus]|uniref:5'-nucleotidase n=1 Tax=Antricoccus suffuscus TaxID=1629062 RepID=A0A2T1A3I6_9ACTN|nr:bifunctional UDP-sugar hydrolase/5'-nucleotidase [Antricoccus suffuscus]PRZ43169.1 5'-nucleotidase [Antricoccus suffuscus]